MQTEPFVSTSEQPTVDPSLTLDALLALDAPTLERLYCTARVPQIESLDGDLKGRMLAVVATPGWVSALPRRWAASNSFPWRGKSFRSLGALHGEGRNRVVSDRVKLFRFTTFVGRSRAGDFDAVQLDYDHPTNPGFIRMIKDEVRELRPGLWLGQAWLQLRGSTRLVLYFGLSR